ncbi:Uncharacterised protein [Mycobacterium tuberculosis]|nr:Uncharacterised protein [Mycobacterium tuberculosis]
MCPTEVLEEFEHYAAGGLRRLAGAVLFAGGVHLVGLVSQRGPLRDVDEPVAVLRDVVGQRLLVGIVDRKCHIQHVLRARGVHMADLAGLHSAAQAGA